MLRNQNKKGLAGFVVAITTMTAVGIVSCATSRRTRLPAAADVTDSLQDFDALVGLINKNKVSSVEQLLPLLPPGYRENYLLAYNSRSLQDADFTHPRVIFFGKTADLMISISGITDSSAYNNLEVLNFDEQKKNFTLHEIRFKKPGDFSSVAISKPNPQKCTICHGSTVRPVWDTYTSWPGFYFGGQQIILGSIEDQEFRKFINFVRSDPASRYRWLENLGQVRTEISYGAGVGTPVVPPGISSDVLQLPASDNSAYFIEGEPPSKSLGSEDQIVSFDHLQLWHNYGRILNELKASPHYNKCKYAMLAAVMRCSPEASMKIEDFLPDELNNKMASAGLSSNQLAQAMLKFSGAYDESKFARPGNLLPAGLIGRTPPYYSDAQSIRYLVQLRYVLLSQGIDIKDWFLTLEQPSFTFGDNESRTDYLAALLGHDIAESDSDLSAMMNFKQYYSDSQLLNVLQYAEVKSPDGKPHLPEFCSKLQAKSLSSLAAQTEHQTIVIPSDFSSKSIGLQGALHRCIACHSGDTNAPQIPFDSAAKLSPILNSQFSLSGDADNGTLLEKIIARMNSTGPDRMPKGDPLADADKGALTQYFKVLAQ